jgi:hypothetical protein
VGLNANSTIQNVVGEYCFVQMAMAMARAFLFLMYLGAVVDSKLIKLTCLTGLEEALVIKDKAKSYAWRLRHHWVHGVSAASNHLSAHFNGFTYLD